MPGTILNSWQVLINRITTNLKTHITDEAAEPQSGYSTCPRWRRDLLWEQEFKSRQPELELTFRFASSLPTSILTTPTTHTLLTLRPGLTALLSLLCLQAFAQLRKQRPQDQSSCLCACYSPLKSPFITITSYELYVRWAFSAPFYRCRNRLRKVQWFPPNIQ